MIDSLSLLTTNVAPDLSKRIPRDCWEVFCGRCSQAGLLHGLFLVLGIRNWCGFGLIPAGYDPFLFLHSLPLIRSCELVDRHARQDNLQVVTILQGFVNGTLPSDPFFNGTFTFDNSTTSPSTRSLDVGNINCIRADTDGW